MVNTFLTVPVGALSTLPPRRSKKEGLPLEEGHAQCEQRLEG